MSTHEAFPDGIPKGVLDAEDFDKDVNPITLLSHLEEVLGRHRSALEEEDQLVDLSEDDLAEMTLDVTRTGVTLKSSAKYVMTFMEAIGALSARVTDIRQLLTTKVRAEFKEYVPNDDQVMSEEQLKALLRETRTCHTSTDMVKELLTLEQLAADIERASETLVKEVVRVREEAERAREEAELVEKKAKEEKEQKQKEIEEDKRRELEEAERKAEEERRTMEEEQQKQKAEEAEGLDEEEEQQRREEEERLREARNPANWPPFIYHLPPSEHGTPPELGCVLRAPPGAPLEEGDLTVTSAHQLDSSFCLGEGEELASNLLRVNVNRPCDFDMAAWLSVTNLSPRGISSRVTVIRVCTDGQTWSELPTRDARISELPEVRLVEAQLPSLCTMTVAAVSKMKQDNVTVTNKGVKLVSSVDQRVSVIVPTRAVRFNKPMEFKVHPVDHTALMNVKTQGEVGEKLVASSHLVGLQSDGPFLKPVTVWLPNPGSSKRPKTAVPAAGNKKPAAAQRPSTASNRSAEDEDQVVLAWKSACGEWHCGNQVELNHRRDFVSFDLDMGKMTDRFVLLRLRSHNFHTKDVVNIAGQLEEAIRGHPVNMVVRQQTKDMSSVYIEVCKADRTEKLLQTLNQDGFDSGPQPGSTVFLSEGQMIEVKFRGNISSDDSKVIRFPYNSNLATAKRQIFVCEIDRFAQHGLDCFRGHVQFWVKEEVPSTEHMETEGEGQEKEAEPAKPILVNELPITLPKPPLRPVSLNRISVQIEEQGPLNRTYFENLAADLGDEWRQLADFLGVTQTRVQSICREHQDSGSVEKVILEVLACWYKQSARNSDKVADLYWALRDTGRGDIAEELLDKNTVFQKESEEKKENEKMQKAFKCITESFVALREWRWLGRELLVQEPELEQVVQAHPTSLREQCHQMLQGWRQRAGRRATRRALVKALKACKLLEPAEKIKQIR